jgi:hypothetical protein
MTLADVEDVVRDPERSGGEDDADATDGEEQQCLVMTLAATTVLERPLAVEDVAENRRHHAGEDLGDDGLRLEHGEAQ